ncbi:MAG TPA: hypothetical protein VGD01_01130 [Candidatus Elarobacter sp.]|jgi:hypothetical protein
MSGLARVTAWTVLSVIALGSAAGAQSPRPSVRPSPRAAATPAGVSAHAHANLTVAANGTTYAGSAQLAFAQRDAQTRIDVLSVKADALPIPPIAFTAVIDRRANTITMWNDATRQYRVQPFLPRSLTSPSPRPSASPRPSRSPRAQVRGTSPLKDLDVLELSLRMTGHTTTAGLPTTGLAFDLQVRKKGDSASSHVAATAQLADDYLIFPVTLELSVEPGTVPFSGKLSYAIDDVTRAAPAAARFAIPAGYTEAPSLPSVIFGRSAMTTRPTRPAPSALPGSVPPPSPLASPAPSASP